MVQIPAILEDPLEAVPSMSLSSVREGDVTSCLARRQRERWAHERVRPATRRVNRKVDTCQQIEVGRVDDLSIERLRGSGETPGPSQTLPCEAGLS